MARLTNSAVPFPPALSMVVLNSPSAAYILGAQFMHEICRGLDQEDALDAHIVRTALKQLSDKQQRRFRLFFYYGYSENEIARIEGVSQPAVHDSIQAGLRD